MAYALEGSAFVSGAAIQWLRDGLGIIDDAAEMGPLAASVPDSGGVTFVPALTGLGSPQWDPTARGIVTGITRGAGRAQLARACVEAMAFQVRDMTDAMAAASSFPRSPRCGPTGAPPPWTSSSSCRPSRAACAWRARARPSPPRWAPPPWPAWPRGCGRPSDELSALWQADAVFEPQLPSELTDAVHDVWLRAVDKSMGWAFPEISPEEQ